MSIKEAILRCLAEAEQPLTSKQIYQGIVEKKYHRFERSDNPESTVSGTLSIFIKNGDSRVKRTGPKGNYVYYLASNEQQLTVVENTLAAIVSTIKTTHPSVSYKERDLHPLLSTYLRNEKIYAKTIFHEKSENSKENNQKWLHPDMVGVSFVKLKTPICQNFLSVIDKRNTFKILSYEIKKEIKTDYELKQSFFQAVSNSSWANFGYLVAFEFSDALADEMARLNESFGIGIIQIAANPYESKIHYPAKYREIDFRTMDKLCNANKDFRDFMEYIEALLTTASDKHIESSKKALIAFCDSYLKTEEDIVNYCKQKNIPLPDDNSTNGESAN